MIAKMSAPKGIGPRGLLVFLVALSGCHGAGPWYRDQPGDSASIAYRPVYPAPPQERGRKFFVSGYGGADYSPARPRRNLPNQDGPAVPAAPMPAASAPTVSVTEGTWGPE